MVNQAGIATPRQSQKTKAQAPRQKRAPHFRPQDIGYFDPNPQAALLEVKDTHNIYHNVLSFTNRLRVKRPTMDATLLRQNIESCLLGAADDWYTNQLNHLSRVGLRSDANGVKECCDALESRFRDSPGKSLTLLESIRYTVQDVRDKRDPADYVFSIVLNGKNAGIATTDAAQVLLAYELVDGELRRDLSRPTAASMVTELLKELRHQKDIWFDIYGSHEARPSAIPFNLYDSSRQDKGKQPQRQYGSNPFLRAILNALMTIFPTMTTDSTARIFMADPSFLMIAIIRAITTLNSLKLRRSNSVNYQEAVSNCKSPAGKKTQTRRLRTARIVNQTLTIDGTLEMRRLMKRKQKATRTLIQAIP